MKNEMNNNCQRPEMCMLSETCIPCAICPNAKDEFSNQSNLTDAYLSGIELRVASDIAARQRIGILKYGTTVYDNPLPLREWLEHAYQEALDLPIYLKRAIEEIDRENATGLAQRAQDSESKPNLKI